MHICYLTHEYPILDFSHGGVGTFIRNLSYKIVDKGFKVTIIRLSSVKQKEIINDNGVEVYILPKSTKPFSFFFNSISINREIKLINKKNKIDIVETPELGLAFIHKLKGILYIIRMNGGHHFFSKAEARSKEWRKVWQEKKSFAKADRILAVSNYVAEETRKLLNLGDIKIPIICNPIDTERFYQSDKTKIEEHTIFFAGTIIEKKGIRQLVRSLDYLIDDYPNIKLNIVGRDAVLPGSNKLYKPILEAAISEKAKAHITFLGVIPNFEIPKYIERANVCCYPSHMEAMPLAWLEVMAMGKVLIASNTGPGPEIIKECITGYLVNPHDPIDISNKIKYIFENNDEAIRVGKNARDYALKHFDVNILVKKNIDFYKSIL